MTTWTMPWERRATPAEVADQGPSATRAELDAAYRRGRREEAMRRHGSPFLAFIGFICTAAVALMVYLAAQTGSFSNGGALIDRNLANASQQVQAPFKSAASKTGNALESAGQKLKQSAGDQTTNS